MKFFADFYRVSGIPILWLARFTKDVLYLLSHSSILSFSKSIRFVVKNFRDRARQHAKH